jgi:tetratricopeptide (TPR) repeat protein
VLQTDPAKGIIKRNLTIPDTDQFVTNLFFFSKGAQHLLFFTAIKSVGSFLIKEKTGEVRMLDDDHGCNANCADFDSRNERMFAGIRNSDNEVAIYYPSFRGQSWALDGEKLWVRAFHNYAVVVSVIKNQQHQVAVYDLDNKLVAYLMTFTTVDSLLCEPDGIYIISRNTKRELNVQRLVEKTSTEKMDILFRKNMFDIAAVVAQNEGFDKNFIAEISRMHGDHFYEKGDFDNAIECYKKTIDYLEPSYVIIMFLDASKIEYLTSYLQELHSKHSADKEHTALLLNCYVHRKATEQLKEFLDKSDEDYELFDPKTAIDVCVEAKRFDLALDLARKHRMMGLYVKIKIEQQKDFLEALEYIRTEMSPSGVAKTIKEYGQVLMRQVQDKTEQLINQTVEAMNLRVNLNSHLEITDKDEKPRRDSDEEPDMLAEAEPITLTYRQVLEYLMSAFVDFPESLEGFLRNIIDRTPSIDSFAYHKLFELLLQQRKKVKNAMHELENQPKKSYSKEYSSSSLRRANPVSWQEGMVRYEDAIVDLLEEAKNRYDKHHVLMLFQMYDFNEGLIKVCQLMKNKQELMYHYIKANDYEKIMNLCREYGAEDNDLWVQSLTYFSSKEDSQSLDYIQRILSEISQSKVNFLSPLIVLEILSKNRRLDFRIVKDYLKRQVHRYHSSMAKDSQALEENTRYTGEMRHEIQDLRTSARKFTVNKCANCEQKLQPPSVHFLCMHSYHQHCLADNERECQKCQGEAMRALERKKDLAMQSQQHENFYKELEDTADRFEVIARYFSRGLFSSL